MQNNQDKIRRLIEQSVKTHQTQRKEYYLFGKWFYIKDSFIVPINVLSVIEELERKIPSHLFEEVDEFIVGDFDFLTESGLEALYKDGAIYITNSIMTEVDLIENIVHELSHSLETSYGHLIYGDGFLAREFLGKRESLRSRLSQQEYKTDSLNFRDTEYNQDFDMFLYKVVGYSDLNPLIIGIFPSPYAVTSLREYWAVGFEDYFVGDREYIKRVSPILFNKVEEVISGEY